MGEFGTNNSYNSTDQIPPTAPNYVPESNSAKFNQYILPMRKPQNLKMLQGGITEYGKMPAMQLQNGVTDNQNRNNVPLQGNINDSQLRAGINESVGVPTYCLRIEDQTRALDRPVFKSPFTGQVYHNVFIKQSDYDVVQRARLQGSTEQVNLYDDTGHVIQPVLAGAVGGLFSVNYKTSTVVLNLFETPNLNNQSTHYKSKDRYSAAIPEGLKQKYNKYKPFVQKFINGLR